MLKARGVPLPPRGSVQDRVLVEVIQRERFEVFHRSVYLGRVLGLLWGADPARLRRAEDALELAIYQTAWDPEVIRQHLQQARDAAHRQRTERLRDARLMDRVASYSDDLEKEDETAFLAAPEGAPRKGISNAWKKD